jgi:predicted ArsR family transcriptional regulator
MSTGAGDWASIELLAEPTRRRIFEAVRSAHAPITREGVARLTGIGLRLAAFHLDRLAEGGLLDVDYARPVGRAGPGAGRPAKRYRPAKTSLQLSVPPRRDDLVARILAAAMTAGAGSPARRARDAAHRRGVAIGVAAAGESLPTDAALDAVERVLADIGYEPQASGASLRLRNCPFRGVVDVAPDLICALNERLIAGVVDGLALTERCTARLDGESPDCCVTVHQHTGYR